MPAIALGTWVHLLRVALTTCGLDMRPKKLPSRALMTSRGADEQAANRGSMERRPSARKWEGMSGASSVAVGSRWLTPRWRRWAEQSSKMGPMLAQVCAGHIGAQYYN